MKKILLSAICITLVAADCNKEDDPIEEHTHVDGNTVVSLSFHWKWGASNFDQAQTYITSLGENVTITRAQFYVAQPFFKDDLDTLVAEFPDKYFFVDIADGAVVRTIGELNGHLHTMHLILGVDSVANHADPTLYPVDHALSLSNGMHWSWAQGYVFLKLEGKYDSDDDGDVDTADNTFSYHCASDVLRRRAPLEVHHDALTGGALVLDLNVDLATLLAGIDVQVNSSSDIVDPTTTALMDNLVQAISTP